MCADQVEGLIFNCPVTVTKTRFKLEIGNILCRHLFIRFVHQIKLVNAVFIGNLCIHNSRNHGNVLYNLNPNCLLQELIMTGP